MLPRITTLRLWSEEVVLDKRVATRAARQAMLYRVLRERRWLEGTDLWSVAAELATLFDDLTRQAVQLPRDLADFTRQIEKAYRARSSTPLNFEARLVHELWRVASAAGDTLDPETAYYARLARLAHTIQAPVYAVRLEDLSAGEETFLTDIASHVAVTRFEVARAASDALTQTLATTWPAADSPDLLTRAAALAHEHPHSALAARFRIFGASSAEQEAQAIDVSVREWLLAGKQKIGVIVNDRLTARRARALLERAQVLVTDEAGWAFSTTSAATAVGRWLDVATTDCYYRDLFDLLKSPFAFSTTPREHRQQAVWRLEGYARENGVSAGLNNFIALAARRHDHEVLEMLRSVERGIATLGRGKGTITRWLDRLLRSLGQIGVAQGLAADSAGEQLVELLTRLSHDLEGEGLTLGFTDWRRWLARELEGATYRDTAISSPVVFTSLAAAQLRRFDALLLVGCDSGHLPPPDATALFFNQRVRAELGLPTSVERAARIESDLASVIASADAVLATWQCRTEAGEPALLSPLLERLSALHREAYGDPLEDHELAARLPFAEVAHLDARDAAPTVVPAPAAPAGLIPKKISASGYNSLVACPYQFYVRYVLRLAELDDIQEEIEKRDYGKVVHDVLAEYHRLHPRTLALDAAEAVSELERLSEAAFGELMSQDYHARAWLMRWLALIPKYLEWQRAREESGWSWHAAEVTRELELVTPHNRAFTLHGRLDRVDSRTDGTFAVIDYKTQAAKGLRDKTEAPGEDVQLPVYALLWNAPVTEAFFLSLDREGVKAVPVEQEPVALAEAARERLVTMYDALHEGAHMTAHGVEAVCDYCVARGLCRRNYWP